jgi:hypothetical protein
MDFDMTFVDILVFGCSKFELNFELERINSNHIWIWNLTRKTRQILKILDNVEYVKQIQKTKIT